MKTMHNSILINRNDSSFPGKYLRWLHCGVRVCEIVSTGNPHWPLILILVIFKVQQLLFPVETFVSLTCRFHFEDLLKDLIAA
jgi:hypothetical protein